MSTTFQYNLIKEFKPYNKYISQLTKPVLRVLIQVCVHYIESKTCSSEVLDLALTKLSQTGCDIPENFYELYTAVLLIMQSFLRTPRAILKETELRETLKEVRFSEDCIEDLVKVLFNHRDTLTANYREVNSLRSPLKRFDWCINISLLQSGIPNISKPTIIFNIVLSNGETRTFQVPFAVFHRLRYTIATILKEMQILENRAIMKN